MKNVKKIIEENVTETGILDFDWNSLENPKDAIRRRSLMARNLDSISEAFAMEYKDSPILDTLENDSLDEHNIYVGKYIYVTVEDVTISGLKLISDSIKETIINKDNLRDYPGFKSYLMQNSNRVIGRVKEIKPNAIVVDVLEAYYRLWIRDIEENYIKKEIPLSVKNLELTRGGFIGKIDITTLSELTGTEWVNTCFIPGSQIVLNIEQDFEKWIGANVMAIPNKFTTFSTPYQYRDNCLVLSRKRLLDYEGAKNLENIYNMMRLMEKNEQNYDSPHYLGIVTGVIKTSHTCGVFIELVNEHITGLLPCDTYELANYPTGQELEVAIDRLEKKSEKIFNKNKNGNIQWPNVHVIFKL